MSTCIWVGNITTLYIDTRRLFMMKLEFRVNFRHAEGPNDIFLSPAHNNELINFCVGGSGLKSTSP